MKPPERAGGGPMAGHAEARPPELSPFPDARVRVPLMCQTWDELTFLHWRYDPGLVQRLLPSSLEVHTFDGAAWVGLTPFVAGVRPPFAPRHLSLRFPETNVRTYVRGPEGKPGVWFFSLDAGRISPVLGARALYRLPYYWSSMQVTRTGAEIRYRSRRLWPGPGPATDITVEVLESLAPVELTEFDHFLTARWRLFARIAGNRLATANVDHAPWPLVRARVVRLDENLLRSAGLPGPEGTPVVHFSPGVDVRVGPPRLVI